MRRSLAMAGVLACACAPVEDVFFEAVVPDFVEYVGVVLTDGSGAVVGGSGLVPRGDPPYQLAGSALAGHEEVVLVGFDGQLERQAGFPDLDRLRSDHLEGADGDRRLPIPAHLERRTRNGEPREPGAAPAVTADWVVGCPQLLAPGEAGLVDTCLGTACAAFALQDHCSVEIDASSCQGGRLAGDADAQGALSYAESADFGFCEHNPPPSGAVASARCSGGAFNLNECILDVYPSAPEPPFSITRLVLDDAPLQGRSLQDPRHLGSLVVTSSGAVVVSRFESPTDGACTDEPSSLELVDRTTMSVRTATAPPCLVEMAATPTGGFVGVHRGASAHALSQFDDLGRIVRTTELPADVDHVVDVAVGSESVAVLVWRPGIGTDTGLVFGLDTLEPIRVVPLEGSDSMVSVTGLGPGFAFADAGRDVLYIDEGGTPRTVALKETCGKGSPSFVTTRLNSEALLISIRGINVQRVFSLDMSGCAGAAFYEGPREPLALAPWPHREETYLAVLDGTSSAPDDETWVALLDLNPFRFLPGSLAVGVGPALEAAVDPDGAVWLNLAFEGAIVRVTPL